MNNSLAPIDLAGSRTIELAQALVRLDTTNPPGNEKAACDLVAARLQKMGIAVERYTLSERRDSLIARLNADKPGPSICFCGHLDTVPVGNVVWQGSPHSGAVSDGKLWGRGSTDMKGAIAAMVTAFERLADEGHPAKVVLALCASEETGCQGAAQIAHQLGDIGAMLIGEPTGNAVAVAHKGVVWLKLVALGKAAHGSMPSLGINAITKMSKAIGKLDQLQFPVSVHPLLGSPTHNVGTIAGGAATNIVPDRCEITLDVRLIPGLSANAAIAQVEALIGAEVSIETLLALDAVETDPQNRWIESVSVHAAELGCPNGAPIAVSYFTDASVLQPALGFPPVAIVGPGDPALAHQVDEFCSVPEIWRTSQLYERLARDWAFSPLNQTQGE